MKTISFPNDYVAGLFIALSMGVDEALGKSGDYHYSIKNFNRKKRSKSNVEITREDELENNEI